MTDEAISTSFDRPAGTKTVYLGLDPRLHFTCRIDRAPGRVTMSFNSNNLGRETGIGADYLSAHRDLRGKLESRWRGDYWKMRALDEVVPKG